MKDVSAIKTKVQGKEGPGSCYIGSPWCPPEEVGPRVNAVGVFHNNEA
jgi:hypothetical protein